ncbi:YdeI/OmpD-associated family protein [Glutamicibacter sp.]|uniref:YdeI/OmpD-associated family protein n=1 Tax=Glutamicibacter sp. TaxID=1931995 RepID=UPI0028BD3F86|nr:YdeI/OmpD-associated family protein [Glutamicibacter sp.]
MAVNNKVIELTGTVRTVAGRKILEFDENSSLQLPSRGQVAVDVLGPTGAVTAVLEPDGRKGHWVAIDGSGPLVIEAADGDSLQLQVETGAAWPEATVPADLAQALEAAPELDETWQSLTPMARWEWVRWVGATSNPATRNRRVEVSISKLRDGKRRPCCFDLSSCTDPELAKSGKLIS